MTVPDGKGEGPSGPPSYAASLGLGFELVAPMLLGILIGYWVDGKLGTRPWILILGALLGMVTGFAGFLRRALPPRDGGKGTGK